MALNKLQVNIIDGMMQDALKQLELMERFNVYEQMFNPEGLNSITDADLQEHALFKHMTQNELQLAKNGMSALVTALGSYAAGTPSARLLKILQNVPK
jgi:hypothetical protein